MSFKVVALVLFIPFLYSSTCLAAPRGTFKISPSLVFYVYNSQNKKIACAPYAGTYVAGRIVSRRYFEPENYLVKLLEARLVQAKRRRNNKKNVARITQQLNALRAKVASDNQLCINVKVTPTPTPTPQPTPLPSPQPTPLPTPVPTPLPTPLPPPSGDAVSMEALDRQMTEDDVSLFLERAGWGYSSREQWLLPIAQNQGIAVFVDQFMQTHSEDPGTWENATDLLDGDVGQTQTTHTPRGQRAALLSLWTHTNNPYPEKLALFLLSTWTVSGDVIGDETFRFVFWNYFQKLRTVSYAQTNLPNLGVDLARDPLMLIYLNNELNVKGNPNENFARELMELFTLGTVNLDGVPNYTETKLDGSGDIAVAARALTGWQVDYDYSVPQLAASFDQDRHDAGPHVMFVGTGHQFSAENDEDLIRGIFSYHPNTSIYYAKEILKFYLTPDPPRELVEQFAAVIKEENFNLRPALKKLFSSKAFFHPVYRDTLPKSAVEFGVEVIKLLKMENAYDQGETDRLYFGKVMPVNLSPSVFWFNSAASTSSALALERANFVARLFGDSTARQNWDPQQVVPSGSLSSVQVLQQIGFRLGINQISSNAILQLDNYMNKNQEWDDSFTVDPYDNSNLDQREKKGLGAYYILFSMPQFVLK